LKSCYLIKPISKGAYFAAILFRADGRCQYCELDPNEPNAIRSPLLAYHSLFLVGTQREFKPFPLLTSEGKRNHKRQMKFKLHRIDEMWKAGEKIKQVKTEERR